jgi:3-hydroxybutyryl-CoA dehydrogenase
MSVTEMASVTYRAPQCLGMRFSHPVESMKQLEVVRARETDEATIAAGAEVGRRMGKEVVIVEESR